MTLTLHQTQAVRTIDRHWHDLARHWAIPKRSAIDPSAIQDALEYAFIAEQLSGGHARLRVAGGSISAVMGMEVAGMPLAVLVSPDHRDDFARHIAQVFEEPAKLTIALTAAAKFAQPEMTAKVRLYPLLDMGGRNTQLIGSFVTSGNIGRTPRRFEITSSKTTPVAHLMESTSAPILTRGHLRLVVSNA